MFRTMCFRNETFSQISGRNQSLCCIKIATFGGEGIECRRLLMVHLVGSVLLCTFQKIKRHAGQALERITQMSMNHLFTTVIVTVVVTRDNNGGMYLIKQHQS